MGGGTPNYTSVSQPSYGEGMREALEAQVALLTGSKVGEDGADFRSIRDELGLKEGSNLMEELVKKYEAPLRKTTAQVDTDILRQTILGDETRHTYADDGRIIEGYETPSGPSGEGTYRLELTETGTVDGDPSAGTEGYRLINDKGMTVLEKSTPRYDNRQNQTRERVEDAFKEEAIQKGYIRDPQQWTDIASSDFPDKYLINPESGKLQESQPVYKKNDDGTDFIAEPGTFEAGETIRSGTGMVDLLGDTRGVQQAVQSEDYGSYVRNNDDLLAAWEGDNAQRARQGVAQRTIEEWGQAHYEQRGKAAGDEMPTSYSMQDVGRQAGFDEDNRFLGLSALAEDVQAGNLSRQRERDLQDVARLSPLYSDIMEDYKPGTKAAITDAAAVLKTQKDSLTGAGAIDAPASVATGMDDITSGGMSAALARSPGKLAADTQYKATSAAAIDPLAAATSYDPSVGITGGDIGAIGALRTDLVLDAETALTGGLTPREERQISEAFKAQGTMMGRTFDQTTGLAEAKARLLEDRNRQALNRQYAQQVLGQEAGLRQSDLGRGLQAQLANQQAANQAAQYGVGAGLQQEQAGAQFAQQKALADQQAANRAAEFGVGSGMQQELAGAQMDQQTALADQAMQQEAAKYTAQEGIQAQLANEANRQQAASFDVNALQQQQRLNEQLKQAGTLGYVDAATRLAALEDTTTLDPFQAVLNRAGGGSLAGGNQLFGTAQYGLQSGPQYLNPESGLGYISNQATNAANMYGAQQMAGATTSGGIMGGLGSLAGGLLGNPNLFKKCWVAREVYGEHNPAWLLFRNWLDTDAPRWFDKLYLAFGERFANFISNKPRLKARIRLWMDSKIGR